MIRSKVTCVRVSSPGWRYRARVFLPVAIAIVSVFVAGACAEEAGVPSSRSQASPSNGESALALNPISGIPFEALIQPLPGRSGRISSAAPRRSSNFDNRFIGPGETLVLAEIDGPAVIEHIRLTFPGPEPSWLGKDGNADHSELVLRMFWDGASEPAVESPLGDFSRRASEKGRPSIRRRSPSRAEMPITVGGRCRFSAPPASRSPTRAENL